MNLEIHLQNFVHTIKDTWSALEETVMQEDDTLRIIAYSCIPIIGPILLHNKVIAHKQQINNIVDVIEINLLKDQVMKTTYIFAGAVAIQSLVVFFFAALAFNIPWLVPIGEAIVFIGLGFYSSNENSWLEQHTKPRNS